MGPCADEDARRRNPARSRGADRPGRGRRDPLLGIGRLVVDGTNVTHALGAGQGPAPANLLIGKLRSIIPPPVAIDLVFDEPPAPGLGRRIGPGLQVHHAVDRPADDLIVDLVAADRASRPGSGSTLGVLVVTDDGDLRRRVRLRGAATAPTAWLVARLARTRLVAPAAGNRRAAPRGQIGAAATGTPAVDDADERAPWRPGRGATRKRGNPHRRPRGSGAGRGG
ncbi:MAG: hypothetical protein KatS3mg065_0334 [Chloroflexota bacterium]|nr:MAG: hypothetical protein KatS3mg065_0334 [Chloroflexota bacterium]